MISFESPLVTTLLGALLGLCLPSLVLLIRWGQIILVTLSGMDMVCTSGFRCTVAFVYASVFRYGSLTVIVIAKLVLVIATVQSVRRRVALETSSVALVTRSALALNIVLELAHSFLVDAARSST